MSNDNNARNQARAQLASVVEMVAALTVDYDRLEELREERFELVRTPRLRAFRKWGEAHAEEFADLEKAADGCENAGDARRRICEDPLCVEVRSGWASDGADLEPSEFRIVLCTGGPAVQIMGELDEHKEPHRAWIEYQDWGTPWATLSGLTDEERDALLAYCRQFYFGG